MGPRCPVRQMLPRIPLSACFWLRFACGRSSCPRDSSAAQRKSRLHEVRGVFYTSRSTSSRRHCRVRPAPLRAEFFRSAGAAAGLRGSEGPAGPRGRWVLATRRPVGALAAGSPVAGPSPRASAGARGDRPNGATGPRARPDHRSHGPTCATGATGATGPVTQARLGRAPRSYPARPGHRPPSNRPRGRRVRRGDWSTGPTGQRRDGRDRSHRATGPSGTQGPDRCYRPDVRDRPRGTARPILHRPGGGGRWSHWPPEYRATGPPAHRIQPAPPARRVRRGDWSNRAAGSTGRAGATVAPCPGPL